MSEQQFGWNYFENEVVIRDKQDKKRMIVFVFSNFMCIPYNRKSFDELVDWLNEQQDLIEELYDFRLTYNALLFNEWAENQKYEVYKSRRHSDGELCFDGEYFIVVANLPTGQVTNHYHIMHWDMFKINEYEKVKEDFDGHTPSDVIERLQQVIDV